MKTWLLAVMICTLPLSAQTLTTIYTFSGQDGSLPSAGLITDGTNLYGTTSTGGDFNLGTVFELSPDGIGGWLHTTLYSFTGGADGQTPFTELLLANGILYGTSYGGFQAACPPACGSVFQLTPSESGWTFQVLHTFKKTDGANINGGLTIDKNGMLYGTALNGGVKGYGVVFQLTNGVFSILHSFADDAGGAGPSGTLVFDAAGNLYGVTNWGGTSDKGTVFRLKPGKPWKETVLHRFGGGGMGQMPMCGLTWDAQGNLYGIATSGSWGSVYREAPVNGKWIWKKLYGFRYHEAAQFPSGSVTVDANGNLYGPTNRGAGALYKLAPGIPYTESVIYAFGEGSPQGKLLMISGSLYGTTPGGGIPQGCGGHGCGTVFQLTPQ